MTMIKRLLEVLGVAAVILVVSVLVKLTPVVVAAQAPTARAQAGAAAPRTPWGDPDLQGTWDTSSRTPFERPDRLAGRAELTDEEVTDLERGAEAAAFAAEERRVQVGDTGGYRGAVWSDRGRQTKQTSMVIDPPDGKLPPLTPEGELARKTRARGGRFRDRGFDSWEDLHLWERCITRGGMPNVMFPRGYNNNTEIVQTPGYVALYHEMVHEIRIIPLDGRPHLPPNVRQWAGDGRGHWEGNTLVVETTNLHEKVSGLQPWADYNSRSGSGEKLRLVERFTRVDANTIDYRITVDDPQMYTRPWTVAMPMVKIDEPIFEYACHEGNYTMPVVLVGEQRLREREAEAAKTGTPVDRQPAAGVKPPE